MNSLRQEIENKCRDIDLWDRQELLHKAIEIASNCNQYLEIKRLCTDCWGKIEAMIYLQTRGEQ